MDSHFENLLTEWPLPIIRDVDIATAMPDSPSRRYAAVNRALKKGILMRLRRGVYLIGKPFRKTPPSNLQIAHALYGPSYVSFESALFYHQWIPEAVYTTTCATLKRSMQFETPLGVFCFLHVPPSLCYLGVQREGEDHEALFIADPWKALADHYYVHGRLWESLVDLCLDMRIERESIVRSDPKMLQTLSEQYQSSRVRQFLRKMLEEVIDGNQAH